MRGQPRNSWGSVRHVGDPGVRCVGNRGNCLGNPATVVAQEASTLLLKDGVDTFAQRWRCPPNLPPMRGQSRNSWGSVGRVGNRPVNCRRYLANLDLRAGVAAWWPANSAPAVLVTGPVARNRRGPARVGMHRCDRGLIVGFTAGGGLSRVRLRVHGRGAFWAWDGEFRVQRWIFLRARPFRLQAIAQIGHSEIQSIGLAYRIRDVQHGQVAGQALPGR